MFNLLKNLFGQPDKSALSRAIQEGAYLVDVRTPAEFVQGSVKGAVNIPLDQLQKKLDAFKGKKNIVVFCRSGNRSSQAKAILEQHGFTNVINGGTWQNVSALVK
jgi:rhodanese-related sulfurtransferase